MPRRKEETPILAAGGIVTRGEPEKLVAVVQLRKNRDWVLPKGKLGKNEDALAAAQREVLEETGHQVRVHDFLGTLSYEAARGTKLVKFWHMTVTDAPPRKLMRDVKAVEWLPPASALDKLSHQRERAFLMDVSPIVFGAEMAARLTIDVEPPARRGFLRWLWTWFRRDVLGRWRSDDRD